jgi:predicted nucleic acid-binding protein
MNAVDTNVLIYARDPRDAVKQQEAVNLTIALTDGALLWQVACEYVAASRKLVPFGFTQSQAWHELKQMQCAGN